ncbi:MAG TPA: hypothetical protein VFL92_01915 [Sphingomonas sp.]|nr:hypothetical protein [Sphingomonas sp.]
MASLTSAVICGGIAAIVVPWVVAMNSTELLNGWLNGELVRIPVGGGYELHWSWLVFCVVTLLSWGLFAAARDS